MEAAVRNRLVGAGIATIATAATLGGVAIAGGGNSRELERTVIAGPIAATKAGPVVRAGGGRTIQTFYVNEKLVPPDGEGVVIGPRCPNNAGNAIGGGAATDLGIDLSYLSQLNPTNLRTSPRSYYVGVDDNGGADGAGAFVEIQCAKGINVKD